jgi:ribosomal protein S18 acetylase RimI-like enzyme
VTAVPRLVVRRLRPDDWETQRALRLAALADAPDAFVTTLTEAQGFPEQLWRDRIADNPHFVADLDGVPSGMAVGLPVDGQAHLVGAWVRPEARGSGAVEGLLDAVSAWAADEGFDRLSLWVVVDNARARRAYERYGFTPTGRTQPVPGRSQDVEVEMVRRLTSLGRRP